MRHLLFATAIPALLATASPAAAATQVIDISASEVLPAGGPGFATRTFTFDLPTLFENAELVINELLVDDRGVLFLNGSQIDSLGFGGPGLGQMQLVEGGPSDPFTFARSNANTGPRTITSPAFIAGTNNLLLVMNDTGNGILGNTLAQAGSFRYNFSAQVRFNPLQVTTPGVPEPGTWALMILGFAAVGAALRRPKARGARVRYA